MWEDWTDEKGILKKWEEEKRLDEQLKKDHPVPKKISNAMIRELEENPSLDSIDVIDIIQDNLTAIKIWYEKYMPNRPHEHPIECRSSARMIVEKYYKAQEAAVKNKASKIRAKILKGDILNELPDTKEIPPGTYNNIEANVEFVLLNAHAPNHENCLELVKKNEPITLTLSPVASIILLKNQQKMWVQLPEDIYEYVAKIQDATISFAASIVLKQSPTFDYKNDTTTVKYQTQKPPANVKIIKDGQFIDKSIVKIFRETKSYRAKMPYVELIEKMTPYKPYLSKKTVIDKNYLRNHFVSNILMRFDQIPWI